MKEQNKEHEQRTDIEQEQWQLGKKPKGGTYKWQVIKEVTGVQVIVIMRLTLVTGVRRNEQPGDLEAGEEAQVTVSNLSLWWFQRDK
jgi:hypothetical protein